MKFKIKYGNKKNNMCVVNLNLGLENVCFIFLHHKILNVLFFGGQLCTLSGCLDARAVFRFVAESKHHNSYYFLSIHINITYSSAGDSRPCH